MLFTRYHSYLWNFGSVVHHVISYLHLCALAIGFGGVIAVLADQVLRSIVVLAREVRLQDIPGSFGIPCLRIERSTAHVRNHAISASHCILSSPEWVILWCGLWEPDISTISVQMARGESLSDVLLHDDGAAGSVDQP